MEGGKEAFPTIQRHIGKFQRFVGKFQRHDGRGKEASTDPTARRVQVPKGHWRFQRHAGTEGTGFPPDPTSRRKFQRFMEVERQMFEGDSVSGRAATCRNQGNLLPLFPCSLFHGATRARVVERTRKIWRPHGARPRLAGRGSDLAGRDTQHHRFGRYRVQCSASGRWDTFTATVSSTSLFPSRCATSVPPASPAPPPSARERRVSFYIRKERGRGSRCSLLRRSYCLTARAGGKYRNGGTSRYNKAL